MGRFISILQHHALARPYYSPKAVKVVNEVLKALKMEQHPDKTFIGKAVRGFDFLGYSFRPGHLGVAEKTVTKMNEHIVQLYEQSADSVSIGQYVKRWWRWVQSGLKGELREQIIKAGAMLLLPLIELLDVSLFFLFSQPGAYEYCYACTEE